MYAYGNPTVYVDPTGHFPVVEGMADELGAWRKDILDTASESNGFGATVMGMGAGLMGALEFGVQAVNLAGDMTVNAVADENSDSFFVQESRRSLSETQETLGNVATTVKNNPGQVASAIATGVSDTVSGIAEGNPRSIATGASFGFEALTGGGLAKSTASVTKSVTKQVAKSKVVTAATATVERAVKVGGNRVAELGRSAANGAKEAAKQVMRNAMLPGPGKFRAQIGAVGNVSNVRLGSGALRVPKPGSRDFIGPLPEISRYPKAKWGSFDGIPGYSNFFPKNPAAHGLKQGDSIPWVNGTPNYSKYAEEIRVSGLTGNPQGDRLLALKVLAAQHNMTQAAVEKMLSKEMLRIHHYKDDIIQLVPHNLHKLPHQGSASSMRNGG